MTNDVKTMVVKIGSSTIVGEDGRIDRAFISNLARQAAELRRLIKLVVVSSGATACGYPILGFAAKPKGDLPSLQACASAGQCILSAAYDEEFHAHEYLDLARVAPRAPRYRASLFLSACARCPAAPGSSSAWCLS